jgi:hypothetical protein
MARLAPVPSGKVAIKASWFRSVVERIEEIKPISGRFITINPTSDGYIVNASSIIELDVCRDGVPAKITVVGTI